MSTVKELMENKKDNRAPWDIEGLKYKQFQQGTGFFTLCGECNSFTGAKYGVTYSDFIKAIGAEILKIPKEKVLALRTIVDDIGADKGFIISQVGFQSGAIEACQNTNIQLYTFEEFVTLSKNYIQNEILDTYVRRARLLHIRYFSHKKRIRKDYGLRGELSEVACFSGAWLLTTVFDVLEKARTQKYPIDLQTHMVEKVGNDLAEDFIELVQWLNLNLNWLDEKILKAEYQMMQDGVFEPNLIDPDLNQKTWDEIAQSMKGVEDKSFQ